MSQPQPATSFHGACHCGALELEFATALDPAGVHPRACDCGFCRKHGAAYVSDPAGTLRVFATAPGALNSYRQGSETARFLLCARCGVLVAAVFEHEGRLHGAVNAGCLDARAAFGASEPASPQRLAPQEKIARWLRLWVPDVQLRIAGG